VIRAQYERRGPVPQDVIHAVELDTPPLDASVSSDAPPFLNAGMSTRAEKLPDPIHPTTAAKTPIAAMLPVPNSSR
jgi:hypothetical protein